MKNITVWGVDPGIAHTGTAVIKAKTVGYSLITAETLKTSARDETGKRLSIIYDEINATLDAWHIDAIAIARVFHGRNTSSSLTTGAVIGLVHLIAYQRGVPIHLFTPSQVKCASGLGAQADKKQVLKIASGLFGTPLKSHHAAGASLCALTGCLQARTMSIKPMGPGT